MRILFDLNHPVDVNFFKNAILNLKKDEHYIHIIFRERGSLERILRYELDVLKVTKMGEHKKGFLNKIVSQLRRDISIVPYLKKHKIDLIICFGGTSAISAKYCGIPYLAFDDDFEYKIPFYHANWFATRHIYPDFIKFSNRKTFKYHGFKELAYLHPKYLKVSKNILKKYSVLPNEYVFIREIANISLNYKNENSILDQIIKKVKKKGLSILLSIEDKNLKKTYAKDCIVLEEPVSDIFSLYYFSLFAISSGDTVARETAILGIPTIYTGGREMIVNKELERAGLIFESNNLLEIQEYMDTLSFDKKNENMKTALDLVKNKWMDTTSVILKHIEDFK